MLRELVQEMEQLIGEEISILDEQSSRLSDCHREHIVIKYKDRRRVVLWTDIVDKQRIYCLPIRHETDINSVSYYDYSGVIDLRYFSQKGAAIEILRSGYNILVCSHCGKIINDYEYRYIRCSYYCMECVNNMFAPCVCCGSLTKKEELQPLNEGEDILVCSYCYNHNTEEDAITHKKGPRHLMMYVSNLGYLTVKTAKEHRDKIKKCQLCGSYFYTTEKKEIFCNGCKNISQQIAIRGYHDNPKRFYYKNNHAVARTKEFAGFGIELEVQQKDYDENLSKKCRTEILDIVAKDDPRRRLYFMRDGSVRNGFEIISQPHEERELLKINWEKVLETLQKHKFRSHNGGACGFHIHSSRYLYGKTREEQNKNIAKLIYFYEKNWDELFKFSRRETDRWCRKYTGDSTYRNGQRYTISPTREHCENIVNYGYHDRYKAVNITNRNTIEFRMFRGTLVLNTFKSALDLTFALVRNCKTIEWEDIDNVSKWLDGINDTTKAYMKRKNCFMEVIG